jgi:hypothetical protein
MPHSFYSNWPEQDLKGPFGVWRLVAALEIVFWPGTGSLLPFSGETNAWPQAHSGNPGSKLPVWGSTRLLQAATSRRTPNAPWARRQRSCAGQVNVVDACEFRYSIFFISGMSGRAWFFTGTD